jgi:hypothetical protein
LLSATLFHHCMQVMAASAPELLPSLGQESDSCTLSGGDMAGASIPRGTLIPQSLQTPQMTRDIPVGHPAYSAESESPSRQPTLEDNEKKSGCSQEDLFEGLPVASVLDDKSGNAVPAGSCRLFKSVGTPLCLFSVNSFLPCLCRPNVCLGPDLGTARSWSFPSQVQDSCFHISK